MPGNAHFTFWPDLPWSPETDAGDTPNLAAWNARRLEVEDSGLTKAKQNWLHMNVSRDDDNDNEFWHGAHFIYNGGQGSCALFVKTDENNFIIDRMVVKETCALSASNWETQSMWRNKLPAEIDIHRRIEIARKNIEDNDIGDHRFDHLVQFRGYRLLMRKRMYRLYLNLYSGDLYEAALPHFQNWQYNDQFGTCGTNEKVPEEYIWYVFSALVDACLALQYGRSLDQTTWEPITHCDLKLENVLLGRSDDSTTKWPRPVVADFGHAFYETVDADPAENPREYANWTVSDDYAPEQEPLRWYPPVKLNERTDVWGIGKILWCLITNSNQPPARVLPGGRRVVIDALGNKHTRYPTVNWPYLYPTKEVLTGRWFTASRKYSGELKELVRRCLEYRQGARHSLIQLRNAIDRAFEKRPNLKTARPDTGFAHNDEFEQWAVGKTYKRRDIETLGGDSIGHEGASM
ncbi:hypothetical protein K491DRAFT_31418 [Lophiostoma macrostomum CBS 122681]|uniref:Protein kinase domain-containing protein n=1 Tax=Lophiostoma macrostomum CBS 122681 TaxID=1314788 RepID=A0A6A6SYD6_9PLEO|nr:hypothetical protein K491DRAFT_31418 [Lophiostoma macrostomum CBS 122681]